MSGLPGLTTKTLGRCWEHHAQLGSTNDYCKQNAAELPDGAAVTASIQTAGRGRLGRRWNEQPDAGLALSVLRKRWEPDKMTVLPLIAGLAVAEALEALCGAPCMLKWSNDVLLDEKKLCGILCESRVSAGGGFAVIGVGVNLRQTQEDFSRLHLAYATSLFLATDRLFSAPETAAAILNRLEPLLEQWDAEGFNGALRERYRGRCITLGRPVRVLADGGEQTGEAVDIDTDGALLCEIGGVRKRIVAGEASVRGLYGYT